ncbi:MAG TPA: rod shape-determining protein MreD [Steroidobacteraceae bacterium]|jgi:rod shape-determining protein MreD|nr:rod shape-determining protein MreD [Steroidobacteraceae bacterium]
MSVSDGRIGRLRVTVTVIIALILAVLPLPRWMDIARPYLLLLLVIYWSLSAPRIAGLMFAWLCGMAIDLLKGTTLGQHALAFLVVSVLTHKFQLRIRIFPLSQQTLTVLILLLIYEVLVWYTDGVLGYPVTTWARWMPVLTSTLLWPVVVGILDTWNRRSR